MPPDRYGTCEYHLDCQKETTEIKANQENDRKSLDELWRRFTDSEKEVQRHDGQIPPIQKDLDELKHKVEIRSLEDQGYQTMVRNTTKAVEKLHNRLDNCPEKGDVASKQELDDIKTWVRYGWIATVAAVILLIANLALVIIPLIWGHKAPAS
jgi:uncharacterized coiled-coil DUF342 family protein